MNSKFYKRLAMVFTTILMFTFIATSQTTINVMVAEDNDDMEEYYDGPDPVGFMDAGSSDLELCTEDNKQYCGIIFRSVQIPVGATITNAYVQFTADDDNNEAISLEIWGAAEATVTAPFDTLAFGVSSHPHTTALVTWEPPEWMVLEERGLAQQTPDLKAIIQEIIGLTGWVPGNNIMIVLTDPDEATKIHRESEAYEDDTDFPAELFVTYTEGTDIEYLNSDDFSSLIYPNPTEGKLFIINPSKDKFNYEIYSITGKLVASRRNITGSTAEVDLSNLAKGAYFVNVMTTEKTKTNKLILK
jgi:hypothetical protein